MQQALIWTILAISGIFVALTVMIVINKAWREMRNARIERRRRDLEPKVLAWAHGEESSLSRALGGISGSFDTDVLEGILLDHIQRVRGIERERMARGLEQLGKVDEYLANLNKRRWWRRAEAAERLGLAASKRAIAPLSAALDDDAPEVRLRAAKALGQLGGAASAQKLVRALNQPNRWSTIRVADILIGMGHDALEAVLDSYPDLSIEGRLAVLDIIGRIRPVSLSPWLIEQMQDVSSSDIRARAAHALGSIGDPHVAPELMKALDDPEWPVRAMAAKALGKTRSLDAINRLGNALRDEQWWVRHNAARALRDIGPQGLLHLEERIADGDRYAREQAILMLEESGRVDERAADLAASDDARREAVSFFQGIVKAGTISRLRLLSKEHPVEAVRRELLALLPEEAAS